MNRRTRLMAAAGTLLALTLTACGTGGSKTAFPTFPTGKVQAQQIRYQTALNRASNRIPSRLVVVKNGQITLMTPTDPKMNYPCSFQCATATLVGGAYEVTVPIGYVYRDRSYQTGLTDKGTDEKGFVSHPVTKLTYWDPYAHEKWFVAVEPGHSVTLPNALRYYTTANLTKVGMAGFLSYADTVEVNGRTYIYDHSAITGEPSSPYFYSPGVAKTVPVVRTKTGLAICLPKNMGAFAYRIDPNFRPGSFYTPVDVRHDC